MTTNIYTTFMYIQVTALKEKLADVERLSRDVLRILPSVKVDMARVAVRGHYRFLRPTHYHFSWVGRKQAELKSSENKKFKTPNSYTTLNLDQYRIVQSRPLLNTKGVKSLRTKLHGSEEQNSQSCPAAWQCHDGEFQTIIMFPITASCMCSIKFLVIWFGWWQPSI